MLVNFLSRLACQNLIYSTDVDRLGKFQMLQARETFRKSCPSGAQVAIINNNSFLILWFLGRCYRRSILSLYFSFSCL